MQAIFWLGIMVLIQIYLSRSRFKQSQIYPLSPHIYVLGCSINALEINSVSEGISKIYGNRTF